VSAGKAMGGRFVDDMVCNMIMVQMHALCVPWCIDFSPLCSPLRQFKSRLHITDESTTVVQSRGFACARLLASSEHEHVPSEKKLQAGELHPWVSYSSRISSSPLRPCELFNTHV
jgi:hypothetical protein